MTTTFHSESAQYLAELERLAYINGDRLTADLLGALADAKEAEDALPDEFDKAHAEGRAEGIEALREALLPLLDDLEGLAAGRVTKAEVKALHDRMAKQLEGV